MTASLFTNGAGFRSLPDISTILEKSLFGNSWVFEGASDFFLGN